MAAVMLLAGGFLVWDRMNPRPEPAAPVEPRLPEFTPLLTDAELKQVRASLEDGDPAIRWSAIELLFNIRDPQLTAVVDKILAEDPDAELRARVVGLFKDREDLARLGSLVKGLADVEKGVRLASLQAIGQIGDPSVSQWVIAALKDPETEVRLAALQTLGRFHEKRREEFEALAEKLKKDYEAARSRAGRN